MQKFSYLLIFSALFIVSCKHREVSDTTVSSNNKVVTVKTEKAQEITVNKDNNSIKVSDSVPTGKIPDAAATDISTTTSSGGKYRPMFDWPVAEATMTRGFLPNVTRKRKRPHKGIDLAAPIGTAVMAAHDGIVIYAGSGFTGYGKVIMIETTDPKNKNQVATLYGHLSKIIVYEGKKVSQGEVIAALGNTGRSSGPHLHFEIRTLDRPIDPLPYLPAGLALTNDVDNGSPDE